MGFLSDYEAVAVGIADPKQAAQARAGLVREWLGARPKELFDELREQRPIFLAPGLAIVTRHTDVREVLAQDRVFSVRPYTARMERTTGPFLLGMARTPQYDREVSVLRLACPREDLPTITRLVATWAEELLSEATRKGRLDLVSDYARLVPTRLVARYFGVPGPNERALMGWLRPLFHDIFINLGDDPTVRAAATAAAASLREHLDGLIAARHAESDSGADDVLSRLVRLQGNPLSRLDDEGIRRNIGGLIVGAVETTSRSFVQAIDQLLDRPEHLAAAQAAACAGDDRLVSASLFEAMRFNPQNPFLYRLCEEPHTLAAGTDRQTTIPAGTLVFAATLSAMFDPAQLKNPGEFRTDRPAEDHLFFGYGLHACFGRYISPVQLLELARPLLRLKGLRRAGGEEGRIRYDGPFPDALWLDIA